MYGSIETFPFPSPPYSVDSAEISRRSPFKYRRETFSAPSRISRSMSDTCRKKERERESKPRRPPGRNILHVSHLKSKFDIPPAFIREYQ